MGGLPFKLKGCYSHASPADLDSDSERVHAIGLILELCSFLKVAQYINLHKIP
jgi:hypothetical protein